MAENFPKLMENINPQPQKLNKPQEGWKMKTIKYNEVKL